MSYKIAVASSDGKNVDVSFGAADGFMIYEADPEGYSLLEKRSAGLEESCASADSGCAGKGSGCGGGSDDSPKVRLIADCRTVVCKKVGFHIQKQLERQAIVSFDVTCPVDEALKKITAYFSRVDRHQSLRGIANELKE